MNRTALTNTGPRGGLGPKAFTIIELLVVVAILSLLMAILLPAIGRARELGRRIACQANLKQIAAAYTMYLDDYDGRFYGNGGNVSNPHYTFGGWPGMASGVKRRPLNSYLGLAAVDARERDTKVFKCPADHGYRDSNTTRFVSYHKDLGNSYQASTIVVNLLRGLSTSMPDPWGTINQRIQDCGIPRLDNVCEPSRLLWLGDHPWFAQWDPVNSTCTDSHSRRHYHCVAFLDGHAAFVRMYRGVYDAALYRGAYDVDGDYRMQPRRDADETVSELQEAQMCSCGEI